jgi:hypothetical protein
VASAWAAGAGAVSGAAGGAIAETARAIKGEEVSAGSYAKALTVGVVAGTVGGCSTHLSSNASKAVASGVGKAVTRVAVQAGAGTVCATGLEMYENGGELNEESCKRIVAAAGTSVAVAATYECTRKTAIRTDAYKNRMGQAHVRSEVSRRQEKLESLKARLDQLKQHKSNIDSFGSDYRARTQYMKDNNLKNGGQLQDRIIRIDKQIKAKMWGPNNELHRLNRNHDGKVARDLYPPSDGTRGLERAVFSERDGKWHYEGRTRDHNYDDLRKYGRYDCQQGYDAQFANRMKDMGDDGEEQ